MEICEILLLLVNHDFKAIGSCFSVEVDISRRSLELRKEVKKEKPEALSRHHVDPDDLTIWKTKGILVIDDSTSGERMAEILKSIDVDDVDVIEKIDERVLLRDLKLSDGQILLVQLPVHRLIFSRRVWLYPIRHQF